MAPIVDPIFGQDPNQQMGILNPTNGYHQQQDYNVAPVPAYNQAYQQQQQQPLQPQQPPAANFMHPTFHPQPVAPATNQPAVVRQTPEPPKPKAPLPEEFVYLQTVLEELRTQCIQTATNPVNF